MTTDLPNTCQPSPLSLGTLVHIRHNAGLYRIDSPSAWADDAQTVPTHYNVTGPSGKSHKMVPAVRLSLHSEAPQDAVLTVLPDRDLVSGSLRHLLLALLATMAMARRFLGPAFVETHDLRQIADALLPRYFRTRCHRCARGLNNLHFPTCPTCEGVLCKCGGCRCNWPYPPQVAYRRQTWNPPSQNFLHLPR